MTRRLRIVLALDRRTQRPWHAVLKERLGAGGHDVAVTLGETASPPARELDRLLGIERWRRRQGLAARATLAAGLEPAAADLVIDLTGNMPRGSAPVLTLGPETIEGALAAFFDGGTSVRLVACLDGAAVAQALPMIDDRVWLSRVTDNVFAAAVGLLVQCVDRHAAGRLRPIELSRESAEGGGLISSYLKALGTGLAERLARRLRRQRPFYWQVGYRAVAGEGVADMQRLDGVPFTVLPDDGRRFYADPFVLAHEGKHHLFVEEYPYALGRGVISVATLQPDGRFDTPRVVLEAPHHLSYPQIFALGGDVFMLPESGGAKELVLYRAERFPDRWVRDTVLIAGRDVNDATLLEHDGRYWLFATERQPYGSASDTMVVFHAETLRGPWLPHPDNPVAIDLTATRPGGAVIRRATGEIVLPVQDGRGGYGSGLGLMTLRELSLDRVSFDAPRAIAAGPAWPGRGIHTLNRAGDIEAVDGLGEAFG